MSQINQKVAAGGSDAGQYRNEPRYTRHCRGRLVVDPRREAPLASPLVELSARTG